jgi:branched-chain amino acid transport system ATP-binding protein
VLRLDDVHARYGAIVALRGVSIEVGKGDLVALVGANGAGKSTLLSTIAGVLRPHRGAIEFRDKSLVGLVPETIVRRGVAMVHEKREIFPVLTVEENLRLGAYIRKNRAEYLEDLDRMFALFPILQERLHQAAGTLSGGEQQQLAIARALMSHPDLLMLDEPSLGLAPKIVEQVFELILHLHEGGMTILLVEQNVAQSLAIADRAYVLNMGAVQAAGTPDELREHVDMASVYLGGAARDGGR